MGPESSRGSTAAQHNGSNTHGNPAVALEHLAAHPRIQTRGFYTPQRDSYLVALAQADPLGSTDKFVAHNYEVLYGRLLEVAPGEDAPVRLSHRHYYARAPLLSSCSWPACQGHVAIILCAAGRHRVHKLFEVGLGCNMGTGPAVGASARLWRRYFPHAEVWFAEYDARCVQARERELQALGVRVVMGDQEDPEVLWRWVNETGGGFDLIVDDGGHTNAQQYQSFMHLFQHALKPGGAYVIEDLNWSRSFGCVASSPSCVVMAEALLQWVDALIFRHCEWVWDRQPLPGHLGKVARPQPWHPRACAPSSAPQRPAW